MSKTPSPGQSLDLVSEGRRRGKRGREEEKGGEGKRGKEEEERIRDVSAPLITTYLSTEFFPLLFQPPSYNETMWHDPGASPGGPPPLPSKGPAGGEPDALKPPSNFSLPDLPGKSPRKRKKKICVVASTQNHYSLDSYNHFIS